MNNTKARLDPDKNAKPKTRLRGTMALWDGEPCVFDGEAIFATEYENIEAGEIISLGNVK